jgi:hypothetical protein
MIRTEKKRWEKWLFWFCLWVGFMVGGKTKCAACAVAKATQIYFVRWRCFNFFIA